MTCFFRIKVLHFSKKTKQEIVLCVFDSASWLMLTLFFCFFKVLVVVVGVVSVFVVVHKINLKKNCCMFYVGGVCVCLCVVVVCVCLCC